MTQAELILRAADPLDSEDLQLRAAIARALAVSALTSHVRHPNRQAHGWKCTVVRMMESV